MKRTILLLLAIMLMGTAAKAAITFKIDGTTANPRTLSNYGITLEGQTDSHGQTTRLIMHMDNTVINATTNIGLAITGVDCPIYFDINGVCTITSSGNYGFSLASTGSAYFQGTGTLYVKGKTGISLAGATAATMCVSSGAEVIAEGTDGPGLQGYSTIASKIPTFYKNLVVEGTGSALITKGTTKAIADLLSYSLADGYSVKYPAELTFGSSIQLGKYLATTEWAHITDTGLPINATNFPDANFRSYVATNCDIHTDGYLSRYERWLVSTMDLSDQGIADLTGINYFTKLTSLDLSGNTGITDIDLTSNTLLSALDITDCTGLQTLDCSGTRITELRAMYLPDLISVNVANCAQLESIYITAVPQHVLNALTVTGCTALKSLTALTSNLVSLDVSTCTALETLDLRQSQSLATLTLGSNPALKQVNLTVCGLTALDFSGCPALENLNVYGNQNLSTLDLTGCTALTTLDCRTTRLSTLDVANRTALTSLKCSGAPIANLDVSGCTALQALNCAGSNGSRVLQTLNVTGCTALTELNCQYNKLTSLNLSGCTALVQLQCGNSDMTTFDVSGNTSITEIYFSNNANLTSVNVAGCTNLHGLRLQSNPYLTTLSVPNLGLTKLYVSNCNRLATLDCSGNQISDIDLANCTALTTLDCSRNQLATLSLSTNTALDTLRCNDNLLGSLDLSALTVLRALYCGNNTALSSLSTAYQTDLHILDMSGNTSIYGTFTSIKGTYASPKKLTTLNISGCTGIGTLDCSYNEITSLDVSGCTGLTELTCTKNQLSALTLPSLPSLQKLVCNNNQLTSLDVSACPTITHLNCRENQLTALNISVLPSLATLYCGYNQLTTLDATACSALATISCLENRQMNSLNVSGLSALTTLNCAYCLLPCLDLSGCSALTLVSCGANRMSKESVDSLIISLTDRKSLSTKGELRIFYLKYAHDNLVSSHYYEGNDVRIWHAQAANNKGWYAKFTYDADADASTWNDFPTRAAVKGDLDRNGRLGFDDVNLLVDMLVGKAAVSTYSDVNEDDRTSLADLTTILNKVSTRSGSANGHDYVNLGLPSGTKWATCNVGANAPEETGNKFAWGETAPKDSYTWANYAHCGGTESTLTKYNGSASYGVVDNLRVLESTDDAATVNWGAEWCMPTNEQIMELIDYCVWTPDTLNNVPVYEVKSIANGNIIYMPRTSLYWSATAVSITAYPTQAATLWCVTGSHLYLYNGNRYYAGGYSGSSNYGSYRYNGLVVRPVLK